MGNHFSGFIEAQIQPGRYSCASDVVRAGLRLLEEQGSKRAALRAALIEGEQSRISPRSVQDIWNAAKEQTAVRAWNKQAVGRISAAPSET